MSHKRRKTELRKIIKEITNRDYILSLTANGHYRIAIGGIRLVYCSGTPSDYRANQNLKSELIGAFREANLPRWITEETKAIEPTLMVLHETVPVTNTTESVDSTKADKARLEATVAKFIHAYGLDMNNIVNNYKK